MYARSSAPQPIRQACKSNKRTSSLPSRGRKQIPDMGVTMHHGQMAVRDILPRQLRRRRQVAFDQMAQLDR